MSVILSTVPGQELITLLANAFMGCEVVSWTCSQCEGLICSTVMLLRDGSEMKIWLPGLSWCIWEGRY